jgi:hypothetical protein
LVFDAHFDEKKHSYSYVDYQRIQHKLHRTIRTADTMRLGAVLFGILLRM